MTGEVVVSVILWVSVVITGNQALVVCVSVWVKLRVAVVVNVTHSVSVKVNGCTETSV